MNWFFYGFRFLDRWFELKHHRLYIRIEFYPCDILMVGVSPFSWRTWQIRLLGFMFNIDWFYTDTPINKRR